MLHNWVKRNIYGPAPAAEIIEHSTRDNNMEGLNTVSSYHKSEIKYLKMLFNHRHCDKIS
jgi:hypothetical protein